MQSVPQPDPDVVTAAMPDGDMVLFHLGTRQYFCLNQTGTFLWKQIEICATVPGMNQSLLDAFDISAETAGEAVRELMQDLETHHLITIPEPRHLL